MANKETELVSAKVKIAAVFGDIRLYVGDVYIILRLTQATELASLLESAVAHCEDNADDDDPEEE